MDRQDPSEVIAGIVEAHGRCTNRQVAKATGLTRQAVHHHLRNLERRGVLTRQGRGRGTHYVAGPAWQGPSGSASQFRFSTAGLDESAVWDHLVQSHGALQRLPRNVTDILHYAVTELVNNVIDHADADELTLEVQTPTRHVELTVTDRGHGIFRRVAEGFDLATPLEALQELSKGKVTTQPERHTGEGIFFVSKAVDEFAIDSGGCRWLVDNIREDMAVGSSSVTVGTRVWLRIAAESPRSLREVFDRYTEDYEFMRTRAVIRLFTIGVKFVSRSEARRVAHGLERFREVLLDFQGVEMVGQGFLDEILRVWARAHPETQLRPVNMIEPVAFMVRRAQARAAHGP